MKKISLIILFLFSFFPLLSLAFTETGVGSNLIAQVSPPSPKPGETVKISLTSYGFSIDTSVVSWYVNNVIKSRAVGKKEFVFNLGRVGEKTIIKVYVESAGGQKALKTFTFDPAEIELLWEAESAKPAFYQGKALPSAGSEVKVVALPYLVNRDGQKISSENLVFNWEKNGTPQVNLSGKGKNTAIFKTALSDTQLKIMVKALSQEDGLSISRGLIFNLIKPEILFYEKKPLEGINYGQVLPSEYSLFEDEVTVQAEPYFLPLSQSFFRSFWAIDQTEAVSRPEDPFAITLRQKRGNSGSNRLKFSIQIKDLEFSNLFTVKYGTSILKP